jgi:DNA-binding PadR family transcriptional regulator
MSIRHGILGLLSRESMHGYQLKTAFEHHTGGVWSLNIGQVYTTLDRLLRDGLVQEEPSEDEGRRPYSITAEGRAELEAWFRGSAANADAPARDELLTKVLIAIAAEDVDVRAVIDDQRAALLGVLQAHRSRRQSVGNGDLAAQLAFDALVVKIEAELRWLDLCEDRLGRRKAPATRGRSTT